MRPAVLLLLALVGAACGGVTDPVGPTSGGESPATVATGGEVSDAVAALEAGDLEDFGCGYGFTVGTADGTVRLSVQSGAGFGDAPREGAHELGAAWTGQLVTGSDLFAQWCDDVIEPDEPEVIEEASWVVTGTLEWQLVQGDGQCPSVATAALGDASITADGETVELPDVEFRNESFGCFAG